MVSTALRAPQSWLHQASSVEPPACHWPYAVVLFWVSTGVLEWPFWTKLIVVAIGFTGGLIFMYIQCKVYLQLWRRLKAFNRIITVQNCPEKGLHGVQARTGPLANGRHEAVEVPASAPVPAQEAQIDSDMSVEAAVAPAQNPVWLNCEEVEENDANVKIICNQPSGRNFVKVGAERYSVLLLYALSETALTRQVQDVHALWMVSKASACFTQSLDPLWFWTA